MRHFIFQCPKTGDEYLIDTTTGEYELIEQSNTEAELITVNQMIEEDDYAGDEEAEEGHDPQFKTNPQYSFNTNTAESYKLGTPMVPRRTSSDGLRIENKPVTGYGSGIRVETQMSTTPTWCTSAEAQARSSTSRYCQTICTEA